jgi:hypothetical protein
MKSAGIGEQSKVLFPVSTETIVRRAPLGNLTRRRTIGEESAFTSSDAFHASV